MWASPGYTYTDSTSVGGLPLAETNLTFDSRQPRPCPCPVVGLRIASFLSECAHYTVLYGYPTICAHRKAYATH